LTQAPEDEELSRAQRAPFRSICAALRVLAVSIVLWTLTGCGSSGSSSRTATSTRAPTSHAQGTTPARTPAIATQTPARLRVVRTLRPLPAARSGIAAAAFGTGIVVLGGLDESGASTATVFEVDARGSTSVAGLPGAVHDAAAAEVAGRLLLFGGGQFEGSDRILAVLPGPPREIARLPQALSDLDAVTIGDVAYVVGGWNGTDTNRDIYAARPDGRIRVAARLPLGVRYPAASALSGRVIVAGGETASGGPTPAAWSFDPAARTVSRLPDLPVPTDHAAAATLDGRVYVLGGLRNGAFSDAIMSWAPGERRWRSAGHLRQPVADECAVAFGGGIAVVAGRGPSGKLASVTLLKRG
jgi:hypothetical protein